VPEQVAGHDGEEPRWVERKQRQPEATMDAQPEPEGLEQERVAAHEGAERPPEEPQ
jgi:hypothetical protein